MTDAELLNYLLNDPKFQALFFVLTIWSLIWKGFALWKSAKNNQRNWFIAMLILNTFGIIEITYIFYFSKKKSLKPKEMGQDSSKMG